MEGKWREERKSEWKKKEGRNKNLLDSCFCKNWISFQRQLILQLRVNCHFPDLVYWVNVPSIWSQGTIENSSIQLTQFQFHTYLCYFLSNSLLRFFQEETKRAWAQHFNGSLDQYLNYGQYLITIHSKSEW